MTTDKHIEEAKEFASMFGLENHHTLVAALADLIDKAERRGANTGA